MSPQNDATASYLGYVFQGQYALLALWDASDGDVVSVETDDDVVVEGTETRLTQLKHSLGTPAPVTITNVGFWKTIRIWAEHLATERPRPSDDGPDGTRYLFVTVAEVACGDPLTTLVRGGTRTDVELAAACAALTAEAERVRDERAAPRADGAAAPHAERAAGCLAFLSLSGGERRRLVNRTEILPGSFRITDVPSEVEHRLGGSVRAAKRAQVAERIIERWDRQVARALMRKRSRRIPRDELVGMVEDLIQEHATGALTNDYGSGQPALAELAAEAGGVIEQQIALVDGGTYRVQRALRDRWRARNQRERWMGDDASLVPALKAYDDVLKEAWSDHHGPMCDDCRDTDEAERRRRGLDVLDWAHSTAPDAVPPLRPAGTQAFYIRGMLQQFADDLEVGWHPDYAERLGGRHEGTVERSRAEGGRPDPLEPTPLSDLRDQLPPELAVALPPAGGDTRRPPRARRRRAGAR